MSIDVSSLAYAVRKASETTSQPLKHGHALQLVAAALGYNTLAAYQAAVVDGAESEHLDAAAHAVLDEALLVDRADELDLPQSEDTLVELVNGAFKTVLPRVTFHRSDDALSDALRSLVDNQVYNHDITVSEMASTNNDGVDEIYLPLDLSLAELPRPGDPFELEIVGQITMSPDIERPYSGHRIDVCCSLMFERVGRVAISAPEFHLKSAELDYDWGDNDEPKKISLAQALAEQLDITPEESEELDDVEPMPVEGHDGAIFEYVFDFEDAVSPELRSKLLVKHGSLQLRVPPWFFDNIERGL